LGRGSRPGHCRPLLGDCLNGYGRVLQRTLGPLAVAGVLALFLSGCSELGYPSVHDMPAPRADTTLTPDEVKQATDNLINQREHLSSEVGPTGSTGNPPSQPKPPATVQPVSAQAPIDVTPPATAYAHP